MPNNQKISKELVIQEVVAKLKYFAQLYGIKTIFIAGGYCRSLYRNELWKVKDIDVASAYHEQALQLGGLFASEILNETPRFYARTGTAMIEYPSEFGSIKVEFQGDSVNSYMFNEDVRGWMQRQHIEDVPLMNNVYGRDFTINSMIYSLHNDQLYDPTERAIRDFEKKKIRSLLPAEILIRYNPLAALRAIRFALEYDFMVDPELKHVIKNAGLDNLLDTLSEERIVKDVVKVLETNATKGLKMLKDFNLDRILLNPRVKEYIHLGPKEDKNA